MRSITTSVFAVPLGSGCEPARMATSTASRTRSWRRSSSNSCSSTLGCLAAKDARRGMISRMAKLVGMLMRNKPRSSPASRTLCSASSSASRIGSMRARNSEPVSVGTTARVVRDSRRTPRSDSRSAMIRDACDCDSPHSRAAAEKLPRRATRVYSFSAKMSFIPESRTRGLMCRPHGR